MKNCESMGVWEYGSVGEEQNTPTPTPPHTPTHLQISSSTRSDWLIAFVVVFALGLTGCAYYSFTGATIPQRFDTVAIPLAEDAGTPFSGLATTLTENLIERFAGRTRLELSDNEREADAVLTTRITGYQSTPVSVGGGGRAQRVRVQLAVEARYHDTIRDSTLMARTFTGREEYDPVQSGPNAERIAAEDALEAIADDIFSNATSNW